MHKLKKKRGKKTVTHHFHHVTEKDGSKKHVYLGTDSKKAKDNLTKLQVERMRSTNKLVKDLESAQQKLNKLGHYNRPYEDILTGIKQNHYKQKHSEALIRQTTEQQFPWFKYTVIFIVAFLAFFTVFYSALSNPTITGAATQGITKIETNTLVSTAAAILSLIIILAIVLQYIDYKHKKHRTKE
jgi:hypothetical protein